MEDKSKRAETVRPQVDERCEKRRECCGVLNVTNDENGDESKGRQTTEQGIVCVEICLTCKNWSYF